MSAKLLQNMLRLCFLSSKKHKSAAIIKLEAKKLGNRGFTVLELLAAIVIGTFVILALLDMVVDLLQSDRREFGRSETQREMQIAMDFMVNDLREAAYVYSEKELNVTRGRAGNIRPLTEFLPQFPTGMIPVLAFWKVDPVPYSQNEQIPTNCNGMSNAQECRTLQIKRRSYTLVAYLYAPNTVDNNNGTWRGQARLMRYELRKYRNVNNLDITPGYVDPALQGVSFSSWPYDEDGTTNFQAARPTDDGGNRPVLVDFVDKNRTIVTGIPQNLEQINDMPCPGLPPNNPNYTYTRIPSSNTNNSFFVCVSRSDGVGTTANNQDVMLYLRGNPTGRAGIKVAPLLTIRTQAVARGVVNKKPED